MNTRPTILLSAVLAASACGSSDDLDPEVRRVIDEVLVPADADDGDVAIYFVDAVVPGDDIIAADLADDDGALSIEVQSPGTLYFVDHQPSARYGHLTQFVIVDDDGELSVTDHEFWPVVTGEPFVPSEHDPAYGRAAPLAPRAATVPSVPLAAAIDALADDSECEPKLKVAVTIDGTGPANRSGHDELLMREFLGKQGYEVFALPYTATGRDSGSKHAINTLQTLTTLAGLPKDTIDELVIYYSGGASSKHGWAFGHGAVTTVNYDGIVAMIGAIDAKRVAVIADASYGGLLKEAFERAKGLENRHVRVMTSTTATQTAAFTGEQLAAGEFTDRWLASATEYADGDGVSLYGDFSISVPEFRAGPVQTPQDIYLRAKRPRMFRYEHEGQCVVAHIGSQDYTRFAFTEGDHPAGEGDVLLGEGRGWVYLQDIHGNWVEANFLWWDDRSTQWLVPMRKEGFPLQRSLPRSPCRHRPWLLQDPRRIAGRMDAGRGRAVPVAHRAAGLHGGMDAGLRQL